MQAQRLSKTVRQQTLWMTIGWVWIPMGSESRLCSASGLTLTSSTDKSRELLEDLLGEAASPKWKGDPFHSGRVGL
jgi:hypothetical protein